VRHSYPAAERAAALELLAASITTDGGDPGWHAVERETGISRDTLRRWWHAQRRGAQIVALPRVVAPADPDPVPSFNPATASEAEFWIWRWYQTQTMIPEMASDAARVRLVETQDQIYRELRSALERERDARGLSPDEVRIALLGAAESVPPSFAREIADVFRRRGIVA
jgi:transposase-like protein